MTRIEAFDVRSDEVTHFEACQRDLSVSIGLHEESLTLDNLGECRGADAVSVLGIYPVDHVLSEALAERGVKFLSTRSIGYDNIDIAAANAAGIRVSHILYSPKSVAEYTLMMLLMTIRRMKLILGRGGIQDYSLEGSDGRQLSEMTVGIIGVGRIGSTIARLLQAAETKHSRIETVLGRS
ncbi:hypothetical protein FYJ43_03835 [Cutibacterium sp. WCA-380-WT-3A]|uniref:D-isomer specific 2-hydroxyacid dehydrogenase catalytic domain-containing protein n=1 Tax=Cutibacterium porci TaxID=2605781 RepID=A0A7K0J5K8_9ACTN|nr:NAD(P)-dependent oxidoreductase [Cutibacterium porci]MSS45193.1 hypothetical protein [Cutibacterium porci]